MNETADKLNEMIRVAESICILGHIGPDGDCAGSTLGMRSYILSMSRAEGLQKTVQVYLEEFSEKFSYLPGYETVSHDPAEEKRYDLCIVCDCADEGRLGKFYSYLKNAGKSFCADHHVTNGGFADVCEIRPEASSTCEVIWDLMEQRYVNRDAAVCIYTGIVHDTGVFRYSSTSPHTMEIAGRCMSFGFDFGEIIDDSFFAMSFGQKLILGRALSEMQSRLSGKLVASSVSAETMQFYGVGKKEMDGIIDELRTTRGALCAVFMYQTQNRQYKVSLRSNTDAVDVSRIAKAFGGGGHKRAAGCFMSADPAKNLEKIEAEVEKQLAEECSTAV